MASSERGVVMCSDGYETYIVAIEEAEKKFRDYVRDDWDVFIDLEEFATWHEVDGVTLRAVYRKVSEMPTKEAAIYGGLHVDRLTLSFRTRDFEMYRGRLPHEGERIEIDEKYWEVERVQDEYGIVTMKVASYRGRKSDR